MKQSVVRRLITIFALGLLLVGSLMTGGRVEAATPRMADLTVTDQVSSGDQVNIRVTLRNPAPAGGVAIALASSNAALSVPETLTIAAGKTSATTTGVSETVRVRTKAVVSATYRGVVKTETVVITPVRLAALVAPVTITHGTTATVTVALTGNAPTSGVTVRLVGNRPSVLSVPPTVTIPKGASSVKVSVTAFTHRADAVVTLTAKLSGSPNAATVTTVLGTGFPDATNTPQPTATNTPEPTATNTPEPTATNTPEPTATNTPQPTATNTPQPTATNTPQPTATNTPGPQSLTFTTVWTDPGHYYSLSVCLQNPTEIPATVTLNYSVISGNVSWVDVYWDSTYSSTITLDTVTPCSGISVHADNYDTEPWVVSVIATLNGVDYLSEPMTFQLPY